MNMSFIYGRIGSKVLLVAALLGTFAVGAQTAQTTQTVALSATADTAAYRSYVDFDDALWWKNFGDALLDSLVDQGVRNNYNVAIAARRINIAKNSLTSARSAYYPTLGLSLGWDKERISGRTSSTAGPAQDMSYFNAGVNLSWEIDLFGRITAKAKEGKAQLRVSRADYAATMVSLQAQIATAYFQLRVYQAELEIARRHADSELKVVNITEARHQTGLASQLDVAQAKMVYYSTLASIPQLENSVSSAITAIAVLLGVTPDSIAGELTAPRPLPSCRQLVPFAIPMAVLERRPDVVEARLNIDAMAAALGVAKKEYLPMLELTGSIGTEAHRPGHLFTKDSFAYSVVPTLSWTIFDGLSRRADVATARENMEIQVDNYNLTLLTAFEEADNAMSGYFSNLRYMDDIATVVTYSAQAEELSLDLYKRGLGTFTNVEDALISLLTYELQLVEAHGNALASLVSLYKALGGGWENDIE